MRNIICFGDSNTWGYNPVTKERYPKNIRWTGILQDRLKHKNIRVIEEGLCGRTSIYEDRIRPGRKGIDSVQSIFSEYENIDMVVVMLGTNDCKTYNHTTPEKIAHGVEECLEAISQYVSYDKILLVSPIHLGKNVWKEEFDPEFSEESVTISKGLKSAYKKVAGERNVRFFAASDYVNPSEEDQEHMNENGHKILADAVYMHLAV